MGKVNLQKAKANLKGYLRKELSKRELVQFRIDDQLLEQLLAMAEKEKLPLGTMLRDWVIEKLQQKQIAAAASKGKRQAGSLKVSEQEAQSYSAITKASSEFTLKEMLEQSLSSQKNQKLIAEALACILQDQALFKSTKTDTKPDKPRKK